MIVTRQIGSTILWLFIVARGGSSPADSFSGLLEKNKFGEISLMPNARHGRGLRARNAGKEQHVQPHSVQWRSGRLLLVLLADPGLCGRADRQRIRSEIVTG
jgi:hypothetical protein